LFVLSIESLSIINSQLATAQSEAKEAKATAKKLQDQLNKLNQDALKQAQENSSMAKKSKLDEAELLVLKHSLKMEESKERENNKLNSKLQSEQAKSDGRTNAFQQLAQMGVMGNQHMTNNAVFGMVGSGGGGGFGSGFGGGFNGVGFNGGGFNGGGFNASTGFGGGMMQHNQMMMPQMQMQQNPGFQTLAGSFNAPAGNPVQMAAAGGLGSFVTAPVTQPAAPAGFANQQTVQDFMNNHLFQQFASVMNGGQVATGGGATAATGGATETGAGGQTQLPSLPPVGENNTEV
jgi:hypothetical protein